MRQFSQVFENFVKLFYKLVQNKNLRKFTKICKLIFLQNMHRILKKVWSFKMYGFSNVRELHKWKFCLKKTGSSICKHKCPNFDNF